MRDPSLLREHSHSHRHQISPDLAVVQTHVHRHLHFPEEWAAHQQPADWPDGGPRHSAHDHEKAPKGELRMLRSDGNLGELAGAEAARLREKADSCYSPELGKQYRDLARKLDPPDDPALLAHPASYYREMAEQTSGESLSLSKSYRAMAERRELAGDRRQSRLATNNLTKSAQRR